MRIINLTPHVVNVYSNDSEIPFFLESFQSEGTARVSVVKARRATLGLIPVFTPKYGKVENLPDQSDGIFYIVSAMVRQALPDRYDIFSPGELIRDSSGQPMGCKGLDQNL